MNYLYRYKLILQMLESIIGTVFIYRNKSDTEACLQRSIILTLGWRPGISIFSDDHFYFYEL